MTFDWGNPPYNDIFQARVEAMRRLRSRPEALPALRQYYRANPRAWINDFGVTYDPRNAGSARPTLMPFVTFPRQDDLITFLYGCLEGNTSGLIEKCRDMGATWISAAVSWHLWLFEPGVAVGWGSRKEQLVDKLGDPDSIFEKIRILIRYTPPEFLPAGFSDKEHMPFMRIINPENGSTITGEAGDNIGRGGRKRLFFKDEAQPLDARILTPWGWSTMGDMSVGAQVVSRDGFPATVTHVNDAGEHDVYRLTFSDGTSVEASENHLWDVETRIGAARSKTMRTVEMLRDFRYVSPQGVTQFRYRIPKTSPVHFDGGAERELPLDPYIVGALIGDGSVGGVPKQSPTITTIDQEIVDQFRRLLPEWATLTHAGGIAWRLGDVRGRMGWKWPSRIRRAVAQAGIAGLRSWEKHIPAIYLYSEPADRLALLQGLMDTDGSASNGGSASFHTSSPRLAEDVRFLVQALGGTATINTKPDKRGHRDQHVLHIALNMPVFRLTRKLAAAKRLRNNQGRTILNIEYVGRKPVRCITIDRADGLYLTDHCIVTHNSAHYERPELIEAALGENTNVQIDISSVNGTGNVFHRNRENGVVWEPGQPMAKGRANVLIMDWRHHPLKDQAWYDRKRSEYEAKGILHKFAQEIDRDYSSAVEGVIIPARYVTAAIDAHLKLGWERGGRRVAGLDVADGGGDLNALADRMGPMLDSVDEWGAEDTGVTARRAVTALATGEPLALMYDCIGVGAGVKAELNRLAANGGVRDGITVAPWNAGSSPLRPKARIIPGDPQSPRNGDFYRNLKAQAWWELRNRFERTYRAVVEGHEYDLDDLIFLRSDMPRLEQLRKELSQATRDPHKDKLVVNKAPEGTRSPNMADAVVMAFWPVGGPQYSLDGW